MPEERGARPEARGARPARRSLGEGGLDTAIDLAVRDMLDVEPPPGLRGRVMDRIEHHGPVVSAFRRKFWLIAAPVATAAVIVLAILAPWRDATAPPTTTAAPVTAQREAPPDVAPPPVTPTAMAPRTTGPRAPLATAINAARVRPRRPERLIEAAAAVAVEDTNFTAIGALAGPESIAIERLPDPLPSSIRSIEPAPLQIPALEITALPETPRERREE